jgi:hypothetical protein
LGIVNSVPNGERELSISGSDVDRDDCPQFFAVPIFSVFRTSL